MPPTTVAPPPCEMPAESRSKPLSTALRNEPPKIARGLSASSTITSSNRRSIHEASNPRFASRKPQFREHLGGCFPGPCRSGLLPLASATTVLPCVAHCPRTKRTSGPFTHWSSLLHPQSALETQLVPAGFRLRPRSDGP